MRLAYRLDHASGLDLDATSCIVHRWDSAWPLAPDNGDGFVVDFEGDRNWIAFQHPAYFTGCYRSPEGALHLTHFAGRILSRARGADDEWETHDVPHAMHGVWGLDQEHVWAWGSRGREPTLYFFDGKRWREVSSVFVVDAHEAYACGPGSPILIGAVDEWKVAARHAIPLRSIAKHRGRVWVAAGVDGLLELRGGELVTARTDFEPVKLDARGSLLVSAKDRILETRMARASAGRRSTECARCCSRRIWAGRRPHLADGRPEPRPVGRLPPSSGHGHRGTDFAEATSRDDTSTSEAVLGEAFEGTIPHARLGLG